MINKVKLSSISFWLMLYCLLSYTIFQFIPIYFTNADWARIYYIITSLIFVITTLIQLSRHIQRKGRSAYYWSIPLVIITLIIVSLFSLAMVGRSFLAVWTEAGTFYVSRTNPEVKIISRYVNEGAFGGGTEPDDYALVVHRPLTSWFKIETAIDTNKIDKTEWVKVAKPY